MIAARAFFIALGPNPFRMAKAKPTRAYKRNLLQLSGESLMGGKSHGHDGAMLYAC